MRIMVNAPKKPEQPTDDMASTNIPSITGMSHAIILTDLTQ